MPGTRVIVPGGHTVPTAVGREPQMAFHVIQGVRNAAICIPNIFYKSSICHEQFRFVRAIRGQLQAEGRGGIAK